jgi:virulence-associated protein VapD
MCTKSPNYIPHIDQHGKFVMHCKDGKKKGLTYFEIIMKKEKIDYVINKLNKELKENELLLKDKLILHKHLFETGKGSTPIHKQNENKIIEIMNTINKINLSIKNIKKSNDDIRYVWSIGK